MLIIREVLTAKPGQASKLAKLFKKVFGSDPNPENVFVRLTVCVTCAGAGGGTPSKEKKAEAKKMPEKRADSPASSARFVRRTL
jgi:hypothetical protein